MEQKGSFGGFTAAGGRCLSHVGVCHGEGFEPGSFAEKEVSSGDYMMDLDRKIAMRCCTRHEEAN